MSVADTFELVCAVDDLPLESASLAEVGGLKLAIVRTATGEVHAVKDECTHGAVSLSEGEVEDCTVECWLHGSRFDLVSGRPLSPPAIVPLRVYPVKIQGEDVYVSVAPQTDPTSEES